MKKSIALTLALVFASFQVCPQVAFAQQETKNSTGPKINVVNENYGEPTKAKEAGESQLYKKAEAVSPLDRKVTIRVNNVPIGTFLNSISAQSKINFIMGEEFSGKKISASLTNVTVREALDTLLRVQGLTYQRVGKSDSYVITNRSEEAPNTVTRVYTLNYVSLQPNTSLSNDLNSVMPADVTSSSFGSSGGTSFNVFDSSSNGGPGFSLNNSQSQTISGNGGSAILAVIESVLTKQGKIAIDSRTNKLIITDVPEVFPQIESILEELDIKAPQVLIEAQVIEVSKGSGYDVGFNWNVEGTFTGGSTELPWNYLGRPDSPYDGGGVLKYFSNPGNWSWEEQEMGGQTFGYWKQTIAGSNPMLDWTKFIVTFQALMSNQEARSLGKPKVITMNNNQAMVTTSRDASVGKITTRVGSGDNSETTSGNERKRVGLTLTVTPQVNKEGYVTLTVLPSYSDLVPSETGGDSYDTITRAVTTQVRVKSGQTVVLGGLLQSNEKETTMKVPLLGQIPVIGWLFTSKSKKKSTTDLVIFITPTVLSE